MTRWKEYIIKTKEEVALVDEVTLLAQEMIEHGE